MSGERDLLLATLALHLGDVRSPPPAPRRGAGPERAPVRVRLLAAGQVSAERLDELEQATDRVLSAFAGDAARALRALPPSCVDAARDLLGESRSEAREGASGSTSPARAVDPRQPAPEVPGRYVPRRADDGTPRELTRGAGARVLVVRDEVIGRDVALKVRDLAGQTSAEEQELFYREARLSARLDHPVMAPVFEIGSRADGSPYWTRRFVNGRTLWNAVRAARSLRERLTLVPSFLQVCQCVASAHAHGVVHRDLHSNIVLLGEFGEVTVVEWQRARELERADTTTTPALSPRLRSPGSSTPSGAPSLEQVLGQLEPLDARSDVFGLGAMLFEVLAGVAPAEGLSADETLRALSQGLPPVERQVRGAPPELVAVCRKALSTDPAARYPTAEALARDVDAWLAGRRVAALGAGSLVQVRRFVRRRFAWVATVAGALVVAAVAATLGVRTVQAERAEARHFAELFLGDVADSLSRVPGLGEVVARVGVAAAQHYERTGGVRGLSDAEQRRLGRSFARLCSEAGRARRLDDAARLCALGREAAVALKGSHPDDGETRALEVELAAAEAVLLAQRGDAPGAKARLVEARQGAAALPGAGAPETAARTAVQESETWLQRDGGW